MLETIQKRFDEQHEKLDLLIQIAKDLMNKKIIVILDTSKETIDCEDYLIKMNTKKRKERIEKRRRE